MAVDEKINVTASICILTFNGEEFIRDLLEAAFTQKTDFKYEVIVIDSGSTDKTLSILRDFPKIILKQIENTEFGHGKTRNLVASLASGKFIAFLTQDAVPSHDLWLQYMVEPFYLSEDVFAVLGKQIPRADCVVSVKREITSVFSSLGPDHSLMIHRGSLLNQKKTDFSMPIGFLSDVNTAYRTDYLINKIPFKNVDYAEDQVIGKEILDKGYLKVYSPLGSVLHSHNYPIRKYFRRKFDEHRSIKKVLNISQNRSLTVAIREYIKETAKDVIFALRDKEYSFGMKLYNIFTPYFYQAARLLSARVANSAKNNEKYSLEHKQKNIHKKSSNN